MERCGRCGGEGYVWGDRECREVICPECDGEGDIPYLQDEWYEDDYEDEYGGIEENSSHISVCKSLKKGRLFVHEVSGYRLAGQDWGMTSYQWDVATYSMADLDDPDFHEVTILFGRLLKNGQWFDFPWSFYEFYNEPTGEEIDEIEGETPCPNCNSLATECVVDINGDGDEWGCFCYKCRKSFLYKGD